MTQEMEDLALLADVRQELYGNPWLKWVDAHFDNEKWVYGKWVDMRQEVFTDWQKATSSAIVQFRGEIGRQGDELRKVSVLAQIAELEGVLRDKSKRYLNLVKSSGKEIADIARDLMELEKDDRKLKALKSEYLLKWKNTDKITDEMIIKAKEFPFSSLIDVDNREYARCPFHQDKTASMWVRKNFFHCFSCNESGDTIAFVMKTRNVDFVKAVKMLC